uniref:Cytochrome P450 n=1 Tax=Kalanchoe fedtschenkoi TaxID=63787 RepID=A0A7N0RFH2_KALFE
MEYLVVGPLVAFVFLLLIIWFWLLNRHKPPSTIWPFVGVLPSMIANATQIHDYASHVLQRTRRHTVRVRIRGLSVNFLLTSDPENIHHILSANFANYGRGERQKETLEFLGEGLLMADGAQWKALRRVTSSLFRTKDFLRLVERTTREKVETGLFEVLDHGMRGGLEVDMQDLCLRLTFDVSCIFLLGVDFKSLSPELPRVPFSEALDDLEESAIRRKIYPRSFWRLQRWLGLGHERKVAIATKILDDFMYKQVALMRIRSTKLKAERHPEGPRGLDVTSIFLLDQEDGTTKRDLDGPKVPDKYVRDIVMNLMSAGRDAAGTALTWFFWVISTNPSVESKLVEEMKDALEMTEGDAWRFPSFHELNKLTYLHAVLNETMRLYPPAPLNIKTAVEPDILPSGHRVSGDGEVVFSVYAMGRMEEIWGADCLEFRPERWLAESGGITRVPSSKYISAFSAGPRTCVGKDVAFIMMKMAAAGVVWSYRLRMVRGHHVVSPANSIVLHIKGGLKVNVTKR